MPGPAPVRNIAEYAGQEGEYCVLSACLPSRAPVPVGILLLDRQHDRLHLKLVRDWEALESQAVDPEDREVLEQLSQDLDAKARAEGGAAVMNWLDSNASWAIRASDREKVSIAGVRRTLERLYREHVASAVEPFRTHLPLYSLEVAAGPFRSNQEEIEPEDWVEAPAGLRLTPEMFVATIRGRSMEPLIPDGSLCVFRHNVIGSRTGRLVLVRNSELADENRFTVKRYRSEKAAAEDSFRHTRITLESLNPAFESWDLDPDEEKYEIVAEFVCVLSAD
jgi:SOS-response transcriptional repressor LexA